MIKTFDDAFIALLGNERGYVNNPHDPGGETMWGITKRVAIENGYIGDMKKLPLSVAKGIAKKCYWDKYLCGQLDPRIAFQVFDAAYNGGNPIQWLQKAACVPADGYIGVKTIAAVRTTDPLKIILLFDSYRMDYLDSLEDWPVFGKGWMRRIAQNMRLAAQ